DEEVEVLEESQQPEVRTQAHAQKVFGLRFATDPITDDRGASERRKSAESRAERQPISIEEKQPERWHRFAPPAGERIGWNNGGCDGVPVNGSAQDNRRREHRRAQRDGISPRRRVAAHPEARG